MARDGQRDFDFLFGEWQLRCRRLRHPLSGSQEWYEFDGAAIERPVWGGNANFEECVFNIPAARMDGCALRLYDSQARLWSIYWGTAKGGLVTVPTVGAFDDDGLGEFFNDEVFEGKNVTCRFRWTRASENECRWEQAFSADGRRTWEINWVNDFVRATEPIAFSSEPVSGRPAAR